MKLAFAAISLILAASLPLESQPQVDSKPVQELRDLVRTWDEAFVKGDTETLGRLLADEFEFVGGPKKADYLASFKTRQIAVESAVSSDLKVQVYNDAAIVTGLDTITIKKADQNQVTKWLYMDVWIKRDGRWQCVKTYSASVKLENY
jgi:ketosteroid isomerase-like protein